MYRAQHRRHRAPWGLAALLVVVLTSSSMAQAQAAVQALVLRNDTQISVVVHASSVFQGMVYRTTPCLLSPKEVSPGITLPGTREITLCDARFPTRPLFLGRIPASKQNLFFSIQYGFPPPRLRLQPLLGLRP